MTACSMLLRRDVIVVPQRGQQPLQSEMLQACRSIVQAMPARDIHAEVRNNRLFVAPHMHAGDGNVHTNIPVHSTTTGCCRRPTIPSIASWRSHSHWTG